MTATITPFLTDYDLYLLGEGNHYRIYEKLWAHVGEINDTAGTHFAVWAPNAKQVSVIGDFNGWRRNQHPLQSRGSSGIWEGFIPHVGPGALYKYAIDSRIGNYSVDKADPCGFAAEIPHTPLPRCGTFPTIHGAMTTGCRNGDAVRLSAPQSPFTRCTWAPGSAFRKRVIAG
jgi:hypothetical protein